MAAFYTTIKGFKNVGKINTETVANKNSKGNPNAHTYLYNTLYN
jgi:hypothetical protein